MSEIVIETKRLRLRNWKEDDIPSMTLLNQDPDVMRYFPNLVSPEETQNFILRMQAAFEEYGFCYFAVELIETNKFIGFIGLMHQDYPSKFTPCVDIGWRLKKKFWGRGYATEGAKACLKYGFKELDLSNIYSVCSTEHKASIAVMKKIGMKKEATFIHPNLILFPHLKECFVYSRSRRGD